MQLSRREAVGLALGGAALAALPVPALADGAAAIATFTGGATPGSGGITLTAPEIAENGIAAAASAAGQATREAGKASAGTRKPS